MTNRTSYLIGGLLALCIISVVVLVAIGRDAGQVIEFLTVAIIPTAAALWAGNRADKAVHNTNGRMRELVQTIQVLGGEHMLDREKYGNLIDESPSTPSEGTPRA